MLITKKPSYMGVPTDLIDMEISQTIEDISFYRQRGGEREIVEKVGDEIIKRFLEARKPVIFLGINVARFGWREKMTKILQKTQAKFATTLMGKSIINETSVAEPNYLGIYAGDYSTEGMVELIQSSDCIISIGTVETDLNSGGFSEDGIDFDHVMTLRPRSVKVGKKLYSGISVDMLLDYLLENMTPNDKADIDFVIDKVSVDIDKYKNEKLNQKEFWQIVAQEIIKEGDIVVAEAGSALFGLVQQNLPSKIDFVSQILWASIGYTLPAAVGSAIASPSRRVLLFIGDGSIQLTAQELSLIAKHNLNISVFIINNNGYTIERAIHGAKQPYNDIPSWKYLDLAKSLGIQKTISIKTFSSLIENLGEINKNGAKVIELFFDKMDLPPLLKQVSDKLGAANK
jgi:TPP-dependent 2-oxoacid decarboxylase